MEFIFEMAEKVGYEVQCPNMNLVRIVPFKPGPYVEGTVEKVARYLVRLCRL